LFLGRRQIFLDDNRARPFIQSRFDLGERRPSRLVATAEEDCLSIRRDLHTFCGSQRLSNNRDL
jgi:hypothetical protein